MFDSAYLDFDSFIKEFNQGDFVVIPASLQTQATKYLQGFYFAIYQTSSPLYIAIKKI